MLFSLRLCLPHLDLIPEDTPTPDPLPVSQELRDEEHLRHCQTDAGWWSSRSPALVTLFLPEDLGTYLVVGEGIGAGERQGDRTWNTQDWWRC